MTKRESEILLEFEADMLVHYLNKMRIPAGTIGDELLNRQIKEMITIAIRIRDAAAENKFSKGE